MIELLREKEDTFSLRKSKNRTYSEPIPKQQETII